jgi:hypothetical protein
VVRSAYTAAQQRLATSERVLINHTRAWQAIAASGRHGVVMEADFVPVRDFGRLPLPVPADRVSSSLAYLYSVGIRALGSVRSTRVHARPCRWHGGLCRV